MIAARQACASVFDTRLALRPQRQYEGGVNIGQVSVQRDVAPAVLSNDQFPLAAGNGATDQGTVRQHLDGIENFLQSPGNVGNFNAHHVLEEAIEVIQDLGRQFDARHRQRAGTRALGFRGA